MKPQIARRTRLFHRYIGLFFTPAILFFSLSGALQTLGLHESHGDGPKPPTWIRWMASIHQDQQLLHANPADQHHGSPSEHDHGPEHDREDDGPSPVPLKIFVVLLATGLTASSILGMIIALTDRTSRRTAAMILGLGTVLPVGLLFV